MVVWRKLLKPQCPPSWPQLTFLGLILTILSVLTSSISIIYFGSKLTNLGDTAFVYEYKSDNCTISEMHIQSYECSDKIVWILQFIDQLNRSLVENPFARRKSLTTIETEIKNYAVGEIHECMCRKDISSLIGSFEIRDCQTWTNCILDGDFIRYIQYDHENYYRTYSSFIGFSCISVVLCLIFIPLSIQTFRYQISADNYIEL
jgi:hypothetical protein